MTEKSTEPTPHVPTPRTTAAPVTYAMPTAEPGGLADGVSARRSLTPAVETRFPPIVADGVEQSKYYAGKFVDPASGTHYEAGSGRTTDAPVSKPAELELIWDTVTPMSTLVARYLCAFAALMALTFLLANAYKSYYVATLIVGMFVSGALLPIMEVVPKLRDDSDDVWLFVGLIMVFGPAIGLIIYSVFGLLRQSVNPAIVGCFIVSIVTQVVVYLAAGSTLILFGPPWVQHGFDVRILFVNWSVVASLAGWAAANVFHRFDE